MRCSVTGSSLTRRSLPDVYCFHTLADGLLPTCYWCRGVGRRIEELRAELGDLCCVLKIPVADRAALITPAIEPLDQATAAFERARLAYDCLAPQLSEHSQAQCVQWVQAQKQHEWHVADRQRGVRRRVDARTTDLRLQGCSDQEVQRFSAVAEREETAALAHTLAAEQAAVEAWRRRQRQQGQPGQQGQQGQQQMWQLWLALAACGSHCRHCVDEADDSQCPDCSGAMDADPGEGATCPDCPACLTCLTCLTTARPPAVTSGSLATTHPSRLLGERYSEPVLVYKRSCTGCKYARSYDGKAAGVLNYSNRTLFCEEVMRDYWNSFFVQKGLTIFSYHAELQAKYAQAGGFEEDCAKRTMFT